MLDIVRTFLPRASSQSDSLNLIYTLRVFVVLKIPTALSLVTLVPRLFEFLSFWTQATLDLVSITTASTWQSITLTEERVSFSDQIWSSNKTQNRTLCESRWSSVSSSTKT